VSSSPFYTTSFTRVLLSLLCHYFVYLFTYYIIRMKTDYYITPLLRSRPCDVSVHFSRQSNDRNSGSVRVFLMKFFTWSWSSLDDFVSTFPSPFFKWLASPLNKVLEFVSSPPRIEYLFYFLYIGLGSRVDNSIVQLLRLLFEHGLCIRREIWFVDDRMNRLPCGRDFEFVSWFANFPYYRERCYEHRVGLQLLSTLVW